ncbi:MAG: cysteine desulfurase [Lachnospiraceae bacterium]|nr:cysteine desulfurase [Lachnospiraceae bacterium]
MIYLDNAATTKLKKSALEAMLPLFTENYANPSAVYLAAGKARRVVEGARDTFAKGLNCRREEIFFTSGGTESDNWALFGAAEAMSRKGRHIITQQTEHHAVLNVCKALGKKGFEVTYLGVNSDGLLDPEDVKRALRPDTILVSVMYANNETGVLQKIDEIGEICKKNRTLFHTDAVQAFGHTEIDLEKSHIDLLSASAHKIGGPKGIGLLYKNLDTELPPYIFGGGQEMGLRSGTENVPGIAGFAAAFENRGDAKAVSELRKYMTDRLFKEISGCVLNGREEGRIPGTLNVSVEGVAGESVLMRLSSLGICASTGSACTSRSGEPSHVLKAMGFDDRRCNSSLRFSLNEENTKAEIDETIEALKDIVNDFRGMIN